MRGVPLLSRCTEELESHISHYKELLHLEDLHSSIHWPTVADMEPDAYVPRVSVFCIGVLLLLQYMETCT